MALLDDMRLLVRVAARPVAGEGGAVSGHESPYDPELRMLIDSALADMRAKGVNPSLFGDASGDGMSPLVKQAVACFVKARFGYDNADAARLEESWRMAVCELLNSSANVASATPDEEAPA